MDRAAPSFKRRVRMLRPMKASNPKNSVCSGPIQTTNYLILRVTTRLDGYEIITPGNDHTKPVKDHGIGDLSFFRHV